MPFDNRKFNFDRQTGR